MPNTGSESPSWSNEDADDFWDENISGLDEVDSNVPENDILLNGDSTLINGDRKKEEDSGESHTEEVSESKILSNDESFEGGSKTLRPINEMTNMDNEPAEISLIVESAVLTKEELRRDSHESAPLDLNIEEQDDVAKTGVQEVHDPINEMPGSVDETALPKIQANKALQELETESDFLDDPVESGFGMVNLQRLAINSDFTETGNGNPSDSLPVKNGSKEDICVDGNVQDTTETSTTTHKSDEKDAPCREVLALREEIEALKLQVFEKDLELEQLGKTNDALRENENYELTERVSELENALLQTEEERDHAQGQLEGFLSKISSMKTVFQNFKETQKELEVTRQELSEVIEERNDEKKEKLALQERLKGLENDNRTFTQDVTNWDIERANFLEVIESLKSEALELNSECDRLSQLLGTLRREFQDREETLQDEKYSLEHEVSRIKKQLNEQRSAHSELESLKEEVLIENKNLVSNIEELKDRLSEKDIVLHKLQATASASQKVMESKLVELEKRLQRSEASLQESQGKYDDLQADLASLTKLSDERAQEIISLKKEQEKVQSLEEEVHSKQLAIGKLRHEAIILNEHLTKAISMLKQNSGDDTKSVDRELVSNMFLNFLQIPRGDTKKFEALSLIGGLLEWDEQKKIQAGLIYSGRNDDSKPQRSGIISLWTDFLEKESSKK